MTLTLQHLAEYNEDGRCFIHGTAVRDYADAMRDEFLERIAELEAALAERDRMLSAAYEHADFDEPQTYGDYLDDLRFYLRQDQPNPEVSAI